MSQPRCIELFFGHLTPHLAHIYARVDGLDAEHGWSITGTVRGPECRHAKTLPCSHSLAMIGSGQSQLARAIIPDPCFWSPDSPSLYRVVVELHRATGSGKSELMLTENRELGLRWLGTRRSSFYLEGRRWVMRGVSRSVVVETSLSQWRAAGAAMLVDSPTEDFCREASREGVLFVARGVSDAVSLRRTASWGGAAFALVTPETESNLAAASIPNLILANRHPQTPDDADCPGISVRFIEAETLAAHSGCWPDTRLPIVAVRRVSGIRTLAEARAQCDELQRDLAVHGDFAGYLIDDQIHS